MDFRSSSSSRRGGLTAAVLKSWLTGCAVVVAVAVSVTTVTVAVLVMTAVLGMFLPTW